MNLVRVICCIVLICAVAALPATAQQSWGEWFDNGGQGLPPVPGGVTPGTPGPPVTEGVPTFYSDATMFDTDNPGLPVEDFEESPVPAAFPQGCDEPIDAATNDGTCFSAGDILAGLALRTVEGIRLGCPADCPMIILGPGLLGQPDHVIGPNFFADNTRIVISDPTVCAFGIEIFSNAGTLVPYDVTLTTASGTVMTTTNAGLPTAPGFFGVVTDNDPIMQIDFTEGTSAGELVDNIRFGIDSCGGGDPVQAIPTQNPLGLAALALALLAAAVFALRRLSLRHS